MSPGWKSAESVLGRVASPTVASILISELKVIFAAFRALAFDRSASTSRPAPRSRARIGSA